MQVFAWKSAAPWWSTVELDGSLGGKDWSRCCSCLGNWVFSACAGPNCWIFISSDGFLEHCHWPDNPKSCQSFEAAKGGELQLQLQLQLQPYQAITWEEEIQE